MNEFSPLLRDILYDRIIDVELQYTERYAVTSTVVMPNEKLVVPLGDKENTVWEKLTILPGYSHKEFIQDSFGNWVARTKETHGPVLRYRLSNPVHKENFDQKRRPDGNPLKDGDRLYVNDEGEISKYHVTTGVSGSQGGYIVRDSVHIMCPETGPKPGISFSVNLLPGTACYELVLKICNLNLDLDIRKVNTIIVTAGYRTEGFSQTFKCSVFSNYEESPNPDGVTVFRCIAVGDTDVFTRNCPITVQYLGGTCTIGSTINAVCSTLGLTAHNLLLPEYSSLQISMSVMNTVSDNATALLDWLRKVVTQRIELAERGTKERPVVMIHRDYQNNLFVYCVNRRNVEDRLLVTLPDLDAVKGATFNGVALTLKALWNPKITPGVSFTMQPNIINGANLPNTLDKSAYGNDARQQYMFRCITASIAFSTVGKENEMTILAVPAKYIDANRTGSDVASTIETFALNVYDTYKQEETRVVKIGKSTGDNIQEASKDTEKVKAQVSASRDMFEINTAGAFGESVEYIVQAGDCLSTIAKAWYNPSGAPNGLKYLNKDIDIPKKGKEPDLSKLTDSTKYIGVIGQWHLWPLIAVYTYNTYLTIEKSQATMNPYENFRDLTNPNEVRIGKVLVIPKIGDLDTLKPFRNIFKYAAESYKDVEGYKYFIEAWTSLYYYLGGD